MPESQSKKKGFFGKIIDVISGNPASSEETPEKGKFAPKKDEAIDVRFVRHFTKNGGLFLYCGTNKDVINALKEFSNEHGLMGIGSPDDNASSYLKQTGIKNYNADIKNCDTIFTYCEAMIAFNGGIMVNENQTKGLKINDMPKYHIILGKTSQLVENLSAAMTRVNQLYRENRPMHISTLRGPQDEQVKLASADPNKGRVLFLLLIEDTL
jgi:hypothetical protein